MASFSELGGDVRVRFGSGLLFLAELGGKEVGGYFSAGIDLFALFFDFAGLVFNGAREI